MKAMELLERAGISHLAGAPDVSGNPCTGVTPAEVENGVELYRSGVLDWQKGHLEQALAGMRRAIDAAPQEVPFYFGLGRVLADLGRHQDAADAYRRVLAALPDAGDVHLALGVAEAAIGNLAVAVESYVRAAELNPELPEAFCSLGNCYLRMQRPADAEAAFRRGLQIQPGFVPGLVNLAVLLDQTGRRDEAIALYEEAAAIEPKNVLVFVNLGAALCGQRRFADAVVAIQRALDLYPHSAAAAYNMGIACWGLWKALGSGRTLYSSGFAAAGLCGCVHQSRGRAARDGGVRRRGGGVWRAAAWLGAESSSALNNLGCLYRTMGKLDEAEALIRRVLAIHPDLPERMEQSGRCAQGYGRSGAGDRVLPPGGGARSEEFHLAQQSRLCAQFSGDTRGGDPGRSTAMG